MWKAAVTLLIIAIIAAGAALALPGFATNLIVDALREQTAAEDVQISITDSPRLVFGEIGAVTASCGRGASAKSLSVNSHSPERTYTSPRCRSSPSTKPSSHPPRRRNCAA